MGEKGEKLSDISGKAAEDLKERLTPLGDIRIRKMFGGYGVFEAETMFALVDSKGVIFLKADDTNRSLFEAVGAAKHGRMPYYQVGETVLSDDATLQEWASPSITVSRNAKKKKK
jgi:DNA transformation protein